MKKFFCVILLFSVLAATVFNTKAEGISAVSYVVINADTLSILSENNPYAKLPMASTTKIMTALILCEQASLKATVQITKEMIAVEGSSMGLKAGDTVTNENLLYGIMLASGNDAANAFAISFAGSTGKFSELMNEKALELGLKSTHFVTPSGLDAPGHYTTAYDLALIAAYALKNETFAKVAATKNITFETQNGRTLSLHNHNKLLNMYPDAVGVKTGFTTAAGRCLVSAARRDGAAVICVTLNDRNDWADHIALLNDGFSKCKNTKLEPEIPQRIFSADGFYSAKLSLGEKYAYLSENDKIYYEVFLPDFIYNAANGEQVGFVKVFCNNNYLTRIPIYTETALDKPYKTTFITKLLKNFLIIFRSL